MRYISNINGLTNNSVNCIMEDNEHTIWIGTWDGLNAFDGRNIRTFRYSKSDRNTISNNIIRQILEKDDWLWVATDNGINRLNKKSFKITRYYLQTGSKIPNREKSFILGSVLGEIVCVVRGEGFFLYDKSKDSFRAVTMDFSDKIKDFCTDNKGNLIFLLTDGSVRYVKQNLWNSGLKMALLKKISVKLPIDNMFMSEGRLILCVRNQLYVLNANFGIQYHVMTNNSKPVSQVVLVGDEAYIGFIEGGCMRCHLPDRTLQPIKELPARLSVFSIYKGNQDILWIGTDGQGLAQLYPYHTLFGTVHATHPVRCFCESEKGILVGTKGGGIKRLDTQVGRLSDYLNESNGLLSNSVYTLKSNRRKDIFIGTEGTGINILTHEGRITRLEIPARYPAFKAVYSLHFTNGDSLLWAGTSGNGLIKMNIVKERGRYVVVGFRQYDSSDRNLSLNNDVVYAITSDPDDRYLWFGTRGGGINRIDIAHNKISNLEVINSNVMLSNNDVLSILYDHGLWVGTSYGLNRLELQGESFQMKPIPERLNGKTVHGILKDARGDIWISTNNGLFSLNPSTGKVENYGIGDGLQNDEFSDGAYFRDTHSTLYFGGVGGVNYFDPKRIRLRTFTPPIVLSSLRIYDRYQNFHDHIQNGILHLSYDERFVTFTFTAKDFINNRNCEYAYRLRNLSENWIYMGNKSDVTFTQLPPGEYHLEVKSTNGDRVWRNNVYTLTFRIDNPWWLSLPAWIVYVLLCGVMLWIVRSIIKNRIRMSRELLLAQIEKQHEQKTFESRLNFFTNVAHEFFTPLTLIFTPAQHLLEQKGLSESQRKYLLVIKNNVERMQRLISELMEFRKINTETMRLHPKRIVIEPFVKAVADNYTAILKDHKIEFQVDMNNTSTLYSDKDALEKILFNLLSNAFKYTPPAGYILVSVTQPEGSDTALYLSVKNSGRGLTEQQMKEVFDRYKIFDIPHPDNSVSNGIGLHLTKCLVESLGGEIGVESEVGKYVEFYITIPSMPTEEGDGMYSSPLTLEDGLLGTSGGVRDEHKSRMILIVEDNKDIRQLLKDILQDYHVLTTCDGQEALDEINKNHPDIIICDIMMPRMNGIELVDMLKANPKTSYIPIIQISGKSDIEDQVNAYNHGVDAYITKPFYPRQIISTVENLLSRQDLLKEYFKSSLSSVKVKDGINLHSEDEAFIQSVANFISCNISDETLSPISIADFAGMSKATLYRKFKEIMNKTPSEFIRSIRLEHAARLLRETRLTVSEIMFKSGFSNKSYFYREFQKQYGFSPRDYRNQ